MCPSASAMRILLVSLDYPPGGGGIGTYNRDLSRVLATICPTHVAILRQPCATDAADKDVVVHYISFEPRHIMEHQLLTLAQDVGITHVVFAHYLISSRFMVDRLRAMGIYTYVISYGADVNMVRGIRGHARLYLLLRNHTAVITISCATRRILRRRFPFLRVEIVHPSVSVDHDVNLTTDTANQIVAVGRFVRRKGFDTLIKAVSRVVTSGTPCRVVLVGEGEDGDYLRALSRSLDMETHVSFLSGLTNEELRAVLRQSRLFCLLPRVLKDGDVEGFGIVFLEAAAEGLPVIAGRSGGVPEAVNDGKNGFLVDPLDEKQVSERMITLLQDDDLCRRMGAESLKWARSFDWRNRNVAGEFAFLTRDSNNQVTAPDSD